MPEQQERREAPTTRPPRPAEEVEEAAAPAPAPGSPAQPPPSNLDLLRSQYEAATEDRRTVIPIAPGRFNGNLAARYKPVEWSNTRKSARRAAKGGFSEDSELNYAAGQLVKACDAILIRMHDGEDFVPLHQARPGLSDQPIRYDHRLAEVLGIDAAPTLTATAICRLVFKFPDALNAHYVEFDAWLKEQTDADDDDDEPEDVADRPT